MDGQVICTGEYCAQNSRGQWALTWLYVASVASCGCQCTAFYEGMLKYVCVYLINSSDARWLCREVVSLGKLWGYKAAVSLYWFMSPLTLLTLCLTMVQLWSCHGSLTGWEKDEAIMMKSTWEEINQSSLYTSITLCFQLLHEHSVFHTALSHLLKGWVTKNNYQEGKWAKAWLNMSLRSSSVEKGAWTS